MKILFTGGGSGGHFYPIIAVAEAIHEHTREHKLLKPQLFYLAPDPYDKKALFNNDITFIKISAGKARRYFSIKNFFDIFKTGWGIIKALWRVLIIFPDVVFSKGGFASFPVLLASRVFRIPVVIHESDTYPGRANTWAASFAKKIAISFPEVLEHFPKKAQEKIALTGTPVRKELHNVASEGAHEYLHLETFTPVILVLGGSQGAQRINEAVIEALPELLPHYQVIHQIGKATFTDAHNLAASYLEQSPHKDRYRPFDFLNVLALRMAAGAADIVITRAGATVLSEIALWGKPSIVIPIHNSNGNHQRKNAFAYARVGGSVVVAEANLSPHLLVSEIDRIMKSPEKKKRMSEAATEFAHPDAAQKVAREILDIALEHES